MFETSGPRELPSAYIGDPRHFSTGERAGPRSRREERILRKRVLAGLGCLAVMLFAVVPSAEAQSGGGCQLDGTANFSPGLNNTSQDFSYEFFGSLSSCQSSTSGAPTSGSVEAGRTITKPYDWNYTDSTTFAAAASGGATTVSTAASEGAVATQTSGTVVTIDPGTSLAETRTVTAVSGSGPYTETLSSPLSFSHAAGAVVTGAHSGSASATYQEPTPTGTGSCGSSSTSGTAIVKWADGTTTAVRFTTTGAAAAVNLTGSVVATVDATRASYTGPSQAPPASTHTVNTTRYAGQSALGQLFFQPPDPTACAGAGVTTAGISGFIGLGSSQ